MSTLRVTFDRARDAEIILPASKSIAARQMMLAAYYAHPLPTPGESACADIVNLHRALTAAGARIDVGESGTAYRFMASYLARTPGKWLLTGRESLLSRPITPLTQALAQLGADIKATVCGLEINGRELHGGEIRIDASQSSQYVSSLMLLAPTLSKGLTLDIGHRVVSMPYIHMTANLLRQAGVTCRINSDAILVEPTGRVSLPRESEHDWSAASYFLETALITGGSIAMPGLRPGLQGDAIAGEMWRQLPGTPDMEDTPDLVPAYAATMCALGREFHITGIGHLRVKESNRLATLSSELRQLGFDVRYDAESLWWDGSRCPANYRISSHDDHRIVMALAPLAALGQPITIDGADAVNKSFPGFFKQLEKCGYITHTV